MTFKSPANTSSRQTGTATAPLGRRQFMAAGAGTLALGGLLMAGFPALAQNTSVPLAQLLAPGALPDIWIGNKDAKVSIVEYASLTCSHCAAFHETTYKELKAKYIDTGKVRMTIREFPFDPLATAGFMLGRCGAPEKREAMIDLLFGNQKTWAFADKPFDGLLNIVKQAGVSVADVETCLKNKELYEKVGQVRDLATEKFNVRSTPTFFVNGSQLVGNQALSEFEKIIEPLLK